MPFAGPSVLLLGLAVVAVTLMLPGPLYGPPPEDDPPTLCPQCGVRMAFAQHQPDGYEYRCTQHGRYLLDSEGLTSFKALGLDRKSN